MVTRDAGVGGGAGDATEYAVPFEDGTTTVYAQSAEGAGDVGGGGVSSFLKFLSISIYYPSINQFTRRNKREKEG
jgi:hypothetical protein